MNQAYSISPFGETFEIPQDQQLEEKRILEFIQKAPQAIQVAIQGIGFVGTAMAAALAQVSEKGQPIFNVIGIDQKTAKDFWKIGRIQMGLPTVESTDENLKNACQRGHKQNNLTATFLESTYQYSDVVVIDINLDVHKSTMPSNINHEVPIDSYLHSIQPIFEQIKEECLVILESTVPPGTTLKRVVPLAKSIFKKRGFHKSPLIAHSYERVMPGKNYLKSITSYYRVFAGIDEDSAKKTRVFLEKFIDTKNWPLKELESTTASEMSKVLENSYRAMNIAFIQEWTEFAEEANVNLYEILEAIKMRETHKNIMAPGLGVGGYCLTKDALLAEWGKLNFFGSTKGLEFSNKAIRVNDDMPTHTIHTLENIVNDIAEKHVLICGVSYINDIADTRYSPSEKLYKYLVDSGCNVICQDPVVNYWDEVSQKVNNHYHAIENTQIIILCVRHKEYFESEFFHWISNVSSLEVVIDANNILNDQTAAILMKQGIIVRGIGKGHWKS